MNSLAKGFLVIGAGLTGLHYADKHLTDIPFLPECIENPSFGNCTPDLLDFNVSLPSVDVPFFDLGEKVYTTKVDGGITAIQTTELRWPLFDRVVELDPLQIKSDGDTEYEESGVYMVSNGMEGRIMTIDTGIGADRRIHVVAVDDKNTDIPTDDTIVPIDLNQFTMYTERGAHEFTYAAELIDEYNNCVTQLKLGNVAFQGCILSGTNGHDQPIAPSIRDNIISQHLGYDGCVVRTAAIASNVFLGGEYDTRTWDEVLSNKTVTIGDIAANSLRNRFASSFGVLETQVVVHMSADKFGNAAQWEPADRVDLSIVEELSGGEYQSEDVRIPSFCARGSFSTADTTTLEERQEVVREMFGSGDLTNPDWLATFNEFKTGPIPDEISSGTFLADGTYLPGQGLKPIIVETT